MIKEIPQNDFMLLAEMYCKLDSFLGKSSTPLACLYTLTHDLLHKKDTILLGIYEKEKLKGFILGYGISLDTFYFSSIYTETPCIEIKQLIDSALEIASEIGYVSWEFDANFKSERIAKMYRGKPLYTRYRGDISNGKVNSFFTDAVGLTNKKAESDAAGAAAGQARRSNKLAAEQLEFAKEQYADWQATYGSIQDNLSEYYNDITPDKLIAMGLEAQQREHQAAQEQVQKTLAQRGLGDSNFEAYTLAQMEQQNANQRAAIRVQGEQATRGEQMQFLGVGLGQGQQALGNINQAYGAGMQSAQFNANMYNQQSAMHNRNNMDMRNFAVGTAATLGMHGLGIGGGG